MTREQCEQDREWKGMKSKRFVEAVMQGHIGYGKEMGFLNKVIGKKLKGLEQRSDKA